MLAKKQLGVNACLVWNFFVLKELSGLVTHLLFGLDI